MRRHEKNHMENKTEYPCDKCDLKFQRKDVLERHAAVHLKDTTFQCHVCKISVSDRKELEDHVQTHIEKIVYECLLCDEKFTVAHNYYTHMLVSHEMTKDVAKLMHTEKKDKQVVKILAKNAKVLDPNLPLPVEQAVPASEVKVTNAVTTTFNVNQMVSSILDGNKAHLNAMTRVATENLCLHSQDIRQEETAPSSLLPPVNPMIAFEKNTRLMPLDHIAHDVGFGMTKKPILNMVSCPIEMSNHAYGQTLNEARNSIVHHLGLQNDNVMTDNPIAQLPVSDTLSFPNSVTVSDIACLSSFIGQQSHSSLTQLTSMVTQPDMHSLEQGAIESLRRLQDTNEPAVSQALEAILAVQRQQSGILVSGNLTDPSTSNDNTGVGYRIQNLF